MKRWWVSFSDHNGDALGIALTQAESRSVAMANIKSIAPDYAEAALVEFPEYGTVLMADVEWNRYPKDTFLNHDDMLKYGYSRTEPMEGREIAELADKIGMASAISFVERE